ncbi:MAG: hypothetical protein R3A13_12655 [Bdellovibrionota bacterium]
MLNKWSTFSAYQAYIGIYPDQAFENCLALAGVNGDASIYTAEQAWLYK